MVQGGSSAAESWQSYAVQRPVSAVRCRSEAADAWAGGGRASHGIGLLDRGGSTDQGPPPCARLPACLPDSATPVKFSTRTCAHVRRARAQGR